MSEHNSLKEEIKQQQKQALKGKTLKDKIAYILFYYKKHIIIGIIVTCVVVSLVNRIITHKTNAMSLALVNCNREVDYESFVKQYFESTGLDDKYEMSVDPTYVMVNGRLDYQLEQKFFLATASGQIDVVIAPATFFDAFAKMGYMRDLSELLTDEELKEYESILHEVLLDDEHGGKAEISGLEVTNMKTVVRDGWYTECEEPVYFGIPIESENMKQALDFCAYIQK